MTPPGAAVGQRGGAGFHGCGGKFHRWRAGGGDFQAGLRRKSVTISDNGLAIGGQGGTFWNCGGAVCDKGAALRINGVAKKFNRAAFRNNGAMICDTGAALRNDGVVGRNNRVSQRFNGPACRNNGASQRINGVSVRINGAGLENSGEPISYCFIPSALILRSRF